jgi:perosamine synthetase
MTARRQDLATVPFPSTVKDPTSTRGGAATGSAAAIVGGIERLYRERLACTGVVPLHEPWFHGSEWAYVKECLDTGWVSSLGSYVDRFEQELAERAGAGFAIATANGTAALHAALHALGVRPGDLVICPAISFVATANAIAYCGATPIFLDIEPANLNLDAAELDRFLTEECDGAGPKLRHRATGRRVAAVMAVHLFGHPAEIERIATICAAHAVPLLEDAAEAIGSRHRGRACGTFGAAGVLSFNGNKILTTGGGGAILTNDEEFARRLKHLTTTARVPHGWEYDHDELGFNYRLPNLNAALGCAQLEQLDDFLARKRRLAAMVVEMLAPVPGISLLAEAPGASSNHWLNNILLERAEDRDTVLAETNARGIQTRPCWRLLPDLPMYLTAPTASAGCAVARDCASRLVSLPSSPQLIRDDLR